MHWANVGQATNAELSCGPLSFLLTTSLSNSFFGDDLGALQTLARASPTHLT
jgi:hypothetical protein